MSLVVVKVDSDPLAGSSILGVVGFPAAPMDTSEIKQ